MERKGSDVPLALLAEGKGTRALERDEDSSEAFSRVYPFGAEVDGFRQSMSDAQWQIAAVDGNLLTLAGGPIAFDDQLDGLFLELVIDPEVIVEIVATIYETQQVEVASAAGFSVGALAYLRRDALGTHLTYLERPEAVELYGGETDYAWRAPLERDDIPPVDNLIDNAFLDLWEES